jgi:hypothetical protein
MTTCRVRVACDRFVCGGACARALRGPDVVEVDETNKQKLKEVGGLYERALALRYPFLCVALRCVALRCVALRCVALRCVALRCVALRCVA